MNTWSANGCPRYGIFAVSPSELSAMGAVASAGKRPGEIGPVRGPAAGR